MQINWKSIFRRIKAILFRKTTFVSIASVLSLVLLLKYKNPRIQTIKLSYFLLALSRNQIKEVIIKGQNLLYFSDNWYNTNASLLTKEMLYKILRDKSDVIFSCESPSKSFESIMSNAILFGSMFLLGFQLMGGFEAASFKKKDYKSSLKSEVKFSDVYGLDFAKKDLQEIIDFVKDPVKYEKIGARLRRGVLIYGPPGTGKTLMAKATAGESNSAFLYCTASEFVEIYVGMGQKRVRELFDQARANSPCIIFIDEIDGIGMRREKSFGQEKGADMERSSTLNQLLAEMDGFRENEKIIVVAATNRVLCLDDALLRSGRFDTKIRVELPNDQEREGIVELHLKKKKQLVSKEKIKEIALATKGCSGADLENIVNESAYIAIQGNKEIIEDKDLDTSWKKIKGQREAKQFG